MDRQRSGSRARWAVFKGDGVGTDGGDAVSGKPFRGTDIDAGYLGIVTGTVIPPTALAAY